jgi:hypothetical protein
MRQKAVFQGDQPYLYLGFLGLAWLGLELDKLWGSGLSLKLDQNLVKLKLFKKTQIFTQNIPFLVKNSLKKSFISVQFLFSSFKQETKKN